MYTKATAPDEKLYTMPKTAMGAIDPTPYFQKYGDNAWAAVKTYQAAQVDYAGARANIDIDACLIADIHNPAIANGQRLLHAIICVDGVDITVAIRQIRGRHRGIPACL